MIEPFILGVAGEDIRKGQIVYIDETGRVIRVWRNKTETLNQKSSLLDPSLFPDRAFYITDKQRLCSWWKFKDPQCEPSERFKIEEYISSTELNIRDLGWDYGKPHWPVGDIKKILNKK